MKYFENSKSLNLSDFRETEGAGIQAYFGNIEIKIGQADFLKIPKKGRQKEARTYVVINNQLKGHFKSTPVFREGFDSLIKDLKSFYQLHVLSGDKSTDKTIFS